MHTNEFKSFKRTINLHLEFLSHSYKYKFYNIAPGYKYTIRGATNTQFEKITLEMEWIFFSKEVMTSKLFYIVFFWFFVLFKIIKFCPSLRALGNIKLWSRKPSFKYLTRRYLLRRFNADLWWIPVPWLRSN